MYGLRRQVMIFSKHVNSTADQNIKKQGPLVFSKIHGLLYLIRIPIYPSYQKSSLRNMFRTGFKFTTT